MPHQFDCRTETETHKQLLIDYLKRDSVSIDEIEIENTHELLTTMRGGQVLATGARLFQIFLFDEDFIDDDLNMGGK